MVIMLEIFCSQVDRYHYRSSGIMSQDFLRQSSNAENQEHQARPKRDSLHVDMEYNKDFNSVEAADDEATVKPSPSDQNLLDQLDCGPTRCTYIACKVGPLRKKESVVFRIYSRLWSNTISRLAHHQYEISSRLVAKITKLPHSVDPDYLGIRTFSGQYNNYTRATCEMFNCCLKIVSGIDSAE
jgi:hypothetical protein